MIRPRFLVSLAALLVAAACRSTPEPPPLADAGSSPQADKKRIAKEDCTAWAAHGVDVVLADWKDAASNCPPQIREELTSKLESQKVTLQGGAVQTCTNHLGETYSPGDASCYMAAGNVKAMTGCHFAPMTNPDDSDLVGQLDRIRASCTATKGGSTTL